MGAVTMKDIARELNVSVVTVSKALAGKDGVGEIMRGKIKDVARARGYTPPGDARRQDAVPRKIGILIYKNFIYDKNDEVQPEYFYWYIHNQLSLSLSSMNYANVLEIVTPEMEAEGLLPAILQRGKPDGILVLGQISKRYLERLSESGVPMTLLDFYTDTDRYPFVISNNFHNSYVITSYLIAEGHKDIGFVGNVREDSTTSIQDRYWGMCRALTEHGLPIREEWILCDRTNRAYTMPVIFPKTMPTALVCNCDQAARQTIERLSEAGYRVPEDVSVVGFDDSIYSRVAAPQVTTMALDVGAMTARAVESILGAIDRPHEERLSFIIQGKLIVRESVKRLP